MSEARRPAGSGEPSHPRGLLHARRPVHVVGRSHLGRQHALPPRRGAELLRGVRRERGVLGGDGRVRDSHGRGRGHAWPAPLVPPFRHGPGSDDAHVRGTCRGRRGRRAVRLGLRRHGPRVHVLFGRDGGLAGRRAGGDRVRGAPRPRLRPGATSHRRGDAGRYGRRRPSRADRPLAPLRRTVGAPARGLRHRVCGDARPRLRTATGGAGRAAR